MGGCGHEHAAPNSAGVKQDQQLGMVQQVVRDVHKNVAVQVCALYVMAGACVAAVVRGVHIVVVEEQMRRFAMLRIGHKYKMLI